MRHFSVLGGHRLGSFWLTYSYANVSRRNIETESLSYLIEQKVEAKKCPKFLSWPKQHFSIMPKKSTGRK